MIYLFIGCNKSQRLSKFLLIVYFKILYKRENLICIVNSLWQLQRLLDPWPTMQAISFHCIFQWPRGTLTLFCFDGTLEGTDRRIHRRP